MLALLILIAGIVIWAATGYDVLGETITAVGGAILAVRVIFMALVVAAMSRVVKSSGRR